ncbi:D-3-phosphoglycerate dehydrogenase [Naegleria gruberi]|uniref:2-oxoglutarate reductase n=1 Tax=Naegleria gruberi TaxID=5762 RepID=D2VJX3_NAEGR|nr:D-3-phosphoglycerate dehydrogenase [Naegleria gruberi]EFC42844.1 D-3-phosphoglycerate dehydrogenase [Naegleria gruberi]|eukprot:XP_002675588.1 D-3-phosphoglycerate dehydrogenase [Naegleria gruberi strain NEG-M]
MTSYPKHLIKVLLLENISQTAVDLFKKEGFQVESVSKSLSEEELTVKIEDVHLVGIRSKTKLTEKVLSNAKKLKAVGCYCIGTDQVDLECCEKKGIPVFNSPYANTRSVAELAMSEIVMLSRKVSEHVKSLHQGHWYKIAKDCYEIRGKILGIVGYGHVGSQLGLLAEGFGMSVIYYDIEHKLPLGNAKPVDSMEQVLSTAHFVSLHVPKTEQTNNLIGEAQIAQMQKGSYLLNLSRGSVVDVNALASALKSGHLHGCAVDVFPTEPEKDGDNVFSSPLQNCPNTILTPHIGGSTIEAQDAIGKEVAQKLISYMNEGITLGSVNFPQINPVHYAGCHRLLHIHVNRHGVLKSINALLQDYNVVSQLLGTTKHIGYMVIELDKSVAEEVFKQIKELESTIKARVLF